MYQPIRSSQMPLRQRLLVLISLVLLVSLIGGSVLTYWQSVRRIALEMSAAITVGQTAMTDAIAAIAPSRDVESQIARIVASFDGDRHLRARLVSPDGAMQLMSRVRAPVDPAPNWLNRALGDPREIVSFDLPPMAAHLGRLQIETDSLNEVSEVWDDIRLKFIIIASFCSLVLASVYATLGRALRPLEDLSAGFARVADGDYEAHVSEQGPAELASLYRQFNRMAEKLAEAELQNVRLNDQLSTVQEEERAEIARDLHDEIGPFLFAVDVDAQTIAPLLSRGQTHDVVARSNAIRQSVGHMQTHLKSILGRLRPTTLLDLGLTHAADQLLAFWRARMPEVTFDLDMAEGGFGDRIDAVIFRIFQEGTSNAVRHGKPSHVTLSARRTGSATLRISVSDDGVGFEKSSQRGFGLAGMRERVANLGGTLVLTPSTGGSGVSIIAEFPLEPPYISSHSQSATRAGLP